ncbi:MAG: murein L,D-transpeptidase catalytic domain family protein, partial [Gammaproteobacteria bacterium]|nr:murein L,D-transpeptidase catalytic domain family protein [Gammaproteobacteria bacterium]
MKKKIVSVATLIVASSFLFGTAFAKSHYYTSHYNNQSEAAQLAEQAPNLKPEVVQYALNGFNYAKRHGRVHKNVLTVVDFSQPSVNKRMYVFNLNNHKLLMNMRVAQGKNSGLYDATRFSNSPESRESSLGVYTTGDTYYGHHGDSMKVRGLETGINSNAYSRAIVVHKAWYMSPEFVSQHHRPGRSFGCFAVAPSKLSRLMSTTKNGSVIFAYASPEKYDPN